MNMVASPEFANWFQGSKLVDQSGKPMVLYHGTHADITEFSPSDFFGTGFFGKGITLTSSPDDASKYASSDPSINHDLVGKASAMADALGLDYKDAKAELTKDGGKVYPLYASLKNPLVIGADRLSFPDGQIQLGLAEIGFTGDVPLFIRQFNRAIDGLVQFSMVVANHASQLYRQIASMNNKDGLIIDPAVSPKGNGAIHVVAFDPTQIKSAIGNSGNFDPAKADIRSSQLLIDQEPTFFYSDLARNISAIQAQAMTGLQWFDSVRGLVRKGLARRHDVERSGLGEWLAMQSDKVTKDDVRQYLAGITEEHEKTGLTDKPAFRNWFDGSKVVDSDGRPLVVYHGTSADFEHFSHTYTFFAEDASYANDFAKTKRGNGDRILPVYLSIKKPLDLRSLGLRELKLHEILDVLTRNGMGESKMVEDFSIYDGNGNQGAIFEFVAEFGDELVDAAQAAGFDGLIQHEENGTSTTVAYIAFNPEQIKSAIGNNGEFSPTNPDIRFSMIAEPAETPSIAQTGLTDTFEFEAWFGDSKAADSTGRPLVLYHGTNKEFSVFKAVAGPRSKMVGDWEGIHFTNDREQAQSIAASLARSDGGTVRVVEVYLQAKNPVLFGTYRTKEQALAAGHDSRLTENNVGLQEWTVFDPSQVKFAAEYIKELGAQSTTTDTTPGIAPIVYTAQRSFAHALKPVKDAIYSELIETTDAGPFDGGCVVFADSLQSVIGGTVVVLTNKSGRGDHAAVELGGKLYDFDGPLAPKQFIARFEKSEHAEIAGYRPMEDHDLPDAPRGINGRLVSLLKQAFGMQEVSVQVSLKDSFDIPELQKQLAAVEAKFEGLRALKKYGEADWDAVTKEAAPISHRLFELTGDHYGKPSVKQVKPSDAALEAQYASPDEVPAGVRLWVLKNASLLYSDATDAVRWSRIEDTLRDARYPSGELTLYRAVADGDDIRPGDWDQ